MASKHILVGGGVASHNLIIAIVANRSTNITQLTCGYGCRNQRLRALSQLWVHFVHLGVGVNALLPSESAYFYHHRHHHQQQQPNSICSNSSSHSNNMSRVQSINRLGLSANYTFKVVPQASDTDV
ncbi:hypothetical protein ACLKA7_016147 [Drosophila subpalustris]